MAEEMPGPLCRGSGVEVCSGDYTQAFINNEGGLVVRHAPS
jgi:hypothetical protein